MEKSERRSVPGWAIAFINIILVGLLAVFFEFYMIHYQNKVKEQNIVNIQNLNQSSVELAEKFFENQRKELKNAAQYISKCGFSMGQALDYLNDSNADDASSYEIVGVDFQGYLAKKGEDGQYFALDYASRDYKDLHDIFKKAGAGVAGEVGFMPQFTDYYTALKSFTLYEIIPVKEKDGTTGYYTLMSVSKSEDFSEMIQLRGNYKKISSVMVDQRGDYIIDSLYFKSTNFFQYIYLYNGLSLDEKKELIHKVNDTKNGVLFYKNEAGQDFVYVYGMLQNENGYIVTGIPKQEFPQKDFDYQFTIVVMLVLFILFSIDLLWLSRLNQKLKRSMEKEKKANDAKSDFLARMSHDIRTPLNAVIGFSELAVREKGLSENVSDSLRKINSSGRYLLQLINDILDMSKIESNKFELHENVVNEMDFLKEIADVFHAQAAQKGIKFVTDFPGQQDVWVRMDALRQRQIYSNLLNNAIKFSEKGTTITWKIEQKRISEKEFRMRSILTDQGCGMSNEFLEHIFMPFEQDANRQYNQENGTGLGLSIVKNLVEMMGGTVEVRSEVNQGSTFTVTMNLCLAEKNTHGSEKNQETGKKDLSGKRVLLCEDHPLNREIAIRLLKNQGIEVICAENGEEGLIKYKESDLGYYHWILMDIRMPVMDGLEAARAIRGLPREDAAVIPIIAMTANAFEDDVQNCKEAGMDAHVAKPVEPAILYKTLEKYS